MSITILNLRASPVGLNATSITLSYQLNSPTSLSTTQLPTTVYMGETPDFTPSPDKVIFTTATSLTIQPNKRINISHRIQLPAPVTDPRKMHFILEVQTTTGTVTARTFARYTDYQVIEFRPLVNPVEAGTILPIQLKMQTTGTERIRVPVQISLAQLSSTFKQVIFSANAGSLTPNRETTLIVNALIPSDINGDYILELIVDGRLQQKDIDMSNNSMNAAIAIEPFTKDGDEFNPDIGWGVIDARRAVELALNFAQRTSIHKQIAPMAKGAAPDPSPRLTKEEILKSVTEEEKSIPIKLLSQFPDVPPVGDFRDPVLVPEVNVKGFRGKGVIVAVIDTGVDFTHPDLAPNIWRDKDGNPGFNFADENYDTMDSGSHGTHVAGIIAAIQNKNKITGVAPDAKIMPIKVIGSNNRGSGWDVAQGIMYSADNGAKVINISLGGSFPMPSVEKAIIYATQKGAVVVMSAGNAAGRVPLYPAYYATQNGIAVGATNSTNYSRAGFSNRAGDNPDICFLMAPGTGIASTLPRNGFGNKGGTSMAAPVVSGIVALMLSANPRLTPDQVREILIETAIPQAR